MGSYKRGCASPHFLVSFRCPGLELCGVHRRWLPLVCSGAPLSVRLLGWVCTAPREACFSRALGGAFAFSTAQCCARGTWSDSVQPGTLHVEPGRTCILLIVPESEVATAHDCTPTRGLHAGHSGHCCFCLQSWTAAACVAAQFFPAGEPVMPTTENCCGLMAVSHLLPLPFRTTSTVSCIKLPMGLSKPSAGGSQVLTKCTCVAGVGCMRAGSIGGLYSRASGSSRICAEHMQGAL